ncbi:MAG: exopolysaccharide biosynthesis protein [Betaproteobacteria bacterium]|nr:exopolysaccharide biosynthesis protein [Comamonadaceae bacterium]MCL5969551.1 exopolysaccharide biosynthesis protein [Betaproteobacteria bacterium]
MTNERIPSASDEAALDAPDTLAEHIERVLTTLPEQDLTLHDIVEAVGPDSLMLLTIFLSLIFLVPVSIPGVSTAFGLAIVLIGLTRTFQRKPWLPQRIARRRLAAAPLRAGLQRATVWLHRIDRLSRPHRWPWLSSHGPATLCNNLALVFAGLLLMMPFGLIPFSNTLPALAVIFLSAGMMQRDGLALLLGYAAVCLTLLYFALLITAGGATLMEVWQWMG